MIVKTAVLVVPLRDAEIVAEVVVVTDVVVTVNVAVVAPAATVTVAGTDALVELDERDTTVPLGPAGPVRVIVPVDVAPPVTVLGANVTLVRVAAVIVRLADLVVPLNTPDIEAVADAETAEVLTVKVALVAPPGTVTVAGTVAFELLDESVTTMPSGPAAPVRVTVPVDELPPITEVGETARLLIDAGLIVSVAV